MTVLVHNRASDSVVILSILSSKVEVIVHTKSDAHSTKVEGNLHFDRNIVVHDNQKNMMHVQELYLYLHEAMISVIP